MPSELAELLREAAEVRRQAHIPPPAAELKPWYRVETKSTAPKQAELWIFDVIGSTWFDEGTDAKSFTKDLSALDVEKILLHINSPGGDAFDGLAIYNALVDHKAAVTAVVEGLAASAASFVFQAGDVRRVNRAGQMMIHDAAGFAMGNPREMRQALDMLEKVSSSIAGIYASRGGGSVEDWRDAMRAETWYTADEAVDAGLADEAVDEQAPEPPVRNTFNLRVFNYAGRERAPAPSISKPPASPGPPRERSTPVAHQLTDEQLAELRKRAGVADDASLEDTLAALKAPEPKPDPPGDGNPAGPAGSPAVPASSATMVTTQEAWDAREQRIRRLEAAEAKRRVEERDQVLAQAVKDGKITSAEKPKWVASWDANPEGTRDLIATLRKNVALPVNEMGHAGLGDDDLDAEIAEFEALLPPESRTAGKGR